MPQQPAWVVLGVVVHPGLLHVDAQAEKNERHGESRVKTEAATSKDCVTVYVTVQPERTQCEGKGSQWWEGAILSNTKQMPHCKDQTPLSR